MVCLFCPFSRLRLLINCVELALSHLDLADGEDASKRALRQYLSSLPTQTAVHSAVQTLIRMLLLHTAVSRGCSHLALGTSLTSLSVSLIASISQGGGFAVREELGEDWEKEGAKLRILRPLHEIGMKECAAWAWWESLPVVGKQKIPGGKNGITSLTKGMLRTVPRFHRKADDTRFHCRIGERLSVYGLDDRTDVRQTGAQAGQRIPMRVVSTVCGGAVLLCGTSSALS